MSEKTAISVRGLVKRYGDNEAVAGVDLDVARGEVLAFLGPNGAGKTTTTEILEGFRPRTAGEVSVLGVDPQRAGRDWRARIGIVLQSGATPPELTPRETLALWASYFPRPRGVEEVLDLVGLIEKADARVKSLSGGQRRRLEVGLALIGSPELVFLDEPTTGFDPDARRHFWAVIQGLRDTGTTIFLTTHYMDEARALADRVAIIKSGAIVTTGSPGELSTRAGETTISFRLPAGTEAGDLPSALGVVAPDGEGGVAIRTQTPTASLGRLATWAKLNGSEELDALEVARPTLEDIYLELTR